MTGTIQEPDWSRYRSVADLLQHHAEQRPDKPFLISIDQGGQTLTFGELWRLSNRFARFLREKGLGPGKRIVVLTDNRLEMLALYFAIQRCGAAFCTINIEVNTQHVREMLHRIRPDLVLWHEDVDMEQMGGTDQWIRFGDCTPGGDAGGLFGLLEGYSDDSIELESSPSDQCVISFTSGTASAPKAVIHTFGNYFWIAEQTIDMWKLTDADRMLEYRSFTWASSHMLCLHPALLCGATLLFSNRFSRTRFFDWIRDFRPTMVIGIPTVINMLLSRDATKEDRMAMESLRFMSSSTAPLMVDQHLRFEETYGIQLVQIYGMSEGGVVAGNHVGDRRIGSVGRPGLYQNLSIVGPEGASLAAGEEGEIEIGGAQTGWGYLYEGGSSERIQGTRLKTGDMGHLDEDGFLHVTGRAKDLIIRGGVNVSPLEVDNVLVTHPAVREAATIGVPDAIYGEDIVSFVVLHDGVTDTGIQIRDNCTERLPEAKLPRCIITLDDLPRNDRGKTDRDALRGLWEQEYSES